MCAQMHLIIKSSLYFQLAAFVMLMQMSMAMNSFFGLYEVPNISAPTLLGSIQDVLAQMNNRCRGQCYNGASFMAGKKSGVAKQLDKKHRALLSHCYGHSLNLAASDSVKKRKVVSDATVQDL